MIFTKQDKNSRFTASIVWFLVFLCLAQNASSQNGLRSSQQISCVFENADVEYAEVAAISNVLKVFNKSGKPYTIRVKVTVPGGWRSLTNAEKILSLPAKDTTYIPIRLLGNSKKTKGGVKYNIAAIITIIETGQVVSTSFMAGKPKISSMKMEVQPGSRLYFPNGKSFLPFKVEMINEGNERQDMMLTLNKVSSDLMITDSSGKYLQKKYSQVSVKPYSDTTLPFGVALLTEVRNQKRVDTYGYMYEKSEKSRHHTVYLKAIEPVAGQPNLAETKTISKARISKTIEFIKLNNNKKVNDFDGDVVPLTVMANLNNLFNQQPVMNLSLNGRKVIDQKSYSTYLFQNTFSYYSVSNKSYQNAFGQLGYFHEKGSVQIGTGIQLNMPMVRSLGSSGPGMAGTYNVLPGHKIGFYYSNNRGDFTNFKSGSYNFGYSGSYKKIVAGLGYSLSKLKAKYSSQLISLGLSMPISKFQTISFRASLERYRTDIKVYSGSLLSANYGISYLKQTASSRIQLTYHKLPSFLTGVDSIENRALFNAGLYNNFKIKKNFSLSSQHNLYDNPVFNPIRRNYQQNSMIANRVFFGFNKRRKTVVVPSLYFNYSNYFDQRLLSEGLQFNISKSEPQENFRMGLTMKGGFNRLLSHPQYGTFFTSQFNSFVTIKTWNFNARYFYGPQSQFDVLSTLSRSSKYSQSVYLSASNQYQFKNKHFLIENTFSYNFVYLNLRQTSSLFTQLFYYTQSGWRFNFNLNLNRNVAENIRFTYDPSAQGNFQTETSSAKLKTNSVQFGIGIKKDFGIPLPKKLARKKFTTVHFKVFLDVNGNRQFDSDESPLENVVIRLNDFEAQSDANGDVSFENIAMGNYKMEILSLENLGAWFPIKTDSIDISGAAINFVPFTRGVQILGNVEVSREKFSAGMKENLDVSRIKIFLIDSAGQSVTTLTDRDGAFNFYLPYGSYTLRFDEGVLGSEFELSQNDIQVQLYSGMDSFYHTFYIIERKRKVKTKKFGADGAVIQDSQNDSNQDEQNNEGNQPRRKK